MDLALDHLLYAGPDLERLERELARVSGVPPAPGGRHEGMGTRNALLGLGADAYLELIAPDPDQAGGPFAEALADLNAAELHAWCVRTDDPDALATRIEASGLGVTRREMGRATPEGEELRWELLLPTGHAWAGAAPFFIAWGATPHPSLRLTGPVRLRHLAVLHGDADGLSAWLADVGVATGGHGAVRVEPAPGRSLRADLTGPRGPFALRGGGGGILLHGTR
jgi:hypothetical protein